MFIEVMHFSSVEVPFSSISKIFIHPENGGTGSGGRGGADWPGPRCPVQPNPPRPTSKLFHFSCSPCLCHYAALVRCASLRSALPRSHTLSVAHNPHSALESAPQRSAPILFHFFPPIFLSVLPLRPAQAAVLASRS